MVFGRLFIELAHACRTHAVPGLQQQVREQGGDPTLWVPGPLWWISGAVVFAVYTLWVTLRFGYRYHCKGVSEALKVGKKSKQGPLTHALAQRRIAVYTRWTRWYPYFDVRRTVLPVLGHGILATLLWATWMRLALYREWPGTWIPLHTYCHGGWMGVFWAPLLLCPVLLLRWILRGMGCVRSWYTRDMARLLGEWRHTTHWRAAARQCISFYVRWAYYQYGGWLGWLGLAFLTYLVHDTYVFALFHVRWRELGQPDEFRQSVQEAWDVWQGV